MLPFRVTAVPSVPSGVSAVVTWARLTAHRPPRSRPLLRSSPPRKRTSPDGAEDTGRMISFLPFTTGAPAIPGDDAERYQRPAADSSDTPHAPSLARSRHGQPHPPQACTVL